MDLDRQGEHPPHAGGTSDAMAGYAMAALLVALGVMSVMMTVAMPVWQQTAQREREEELLFRGRQYVRAIGLYEKKYANTPPPTVDVLVQERFLRKKYKDPITNAEFVPIPGAQTPATNGTGAQQGQGQANAQATQAAIAALQAGATAGRGGVIGVTSASKARSLRVFNGASHYNEWRFVYAPPAAAPGAGGGGGQRGGRGQPGQPGQGGNPAGPGGAGGGAGRGAGRGPTGNDGRPGGPGNPGGRGNGPGGAPPLGQGPAGPFGRGR